MTNRELDAIINNISSTARTSGRLREERDMILIGRQYTTEEMRTLEKKSSDALFASVAAISEAKKKLSDALGISE